MKAEDKLNEEELYTTETSGNAETNETAAEPVDEQAATDSDNAEMPDTDKLADVTEKLAEMHDKYLRQVAEFDNYRKRTMKEKADLILNGAERTITAVLPILDDFERALKNMERAEDVAAVKEGVELIYHKFIKTLEGQGVKKINTENADFDTDLHEAIAQIPAPTSDLKGKVLDCVQTGYTLNDKVIRHSKVAVGQ